LNPVYATLFWAVVLNSVKPQGNEPKTFLGKFFVVAFLTFIAHLLYFIPLPEIYVYADSIYYLTHLLVFPLYYIYVRLLSIDHNFSLKKHCKYLLAPFVLFVLYAAGVFFMTKTEYINFIYNTLIEGENVTGVFLYQKIVYFVIRIAFIIQGVVYMTLSVLAVKRNQKNVDHFYSNTEDDSLRKVQWLNATVSVTMTTCVIMEILGKEKFTGHDFFLLAPADILTITLFCIGWLGNRQRAVLLTDMEEKNKNEAADEYTDKGRRTGLPLYKKSTKSRNIYIKKRMEKLFNEKHIYLNKDLTIWELAKQLNTNRSYLSQMINTDYGQNFSTFVNSYRARHAENLQQSHPELSQADIAGMSGFGSVKSWKRAGKE
jgi:AraC-like DNA-binding protein